jgi:ribose 1,5-bisphosphokinase
MSDVRAPDTPAMPIGPGRLILVVGPSGAGKDTLIAGARALCADDASIVFPRRIVTRAATASEAHDTIAPEAFRDAAAAGRFALWWEAHGHGYGIPAAIDLDIRARHTVICNVSRAIAAPARQRYASVAVALVTAPPEVLASRLQSRHRSSDGDLAARIARTAVAEHDLAADVVINNVGAPDIAIQQLIDIIRDVR